MLIKINDEYHISADKYNYIIGKLQTHDKDKNLLNEPVFQAKYYYGNLAQCLQWLIEHLIQNNSNAVTLQELKIDIIKAKKQIFDLCENMKREGLIPNIQEEFYNTGRTISTRRGKLR